MTTKQTHQHTPGPWEIRPSSNPGNGYGWRDIVSLGTVFKPSYVGEALENDAHLISAAPELLAALQETLRVLVTVDGFPDKDKGRTAEQQAAYDFARGAIAKAQGGAK